MIEDTTIQVRSFITASPSVLRRRQNTRGKHRKKERECPLQPEVENRPILSPEEMEEATRTLGPIPWMTLGLDMETIVAPKSTYPILRNGQWLRAGYFELQGLNLEEVARKLAQGHLRSDDRARLRIAGFILPDPDEMCFVGESLERVYAGHDLLADDRQKIENYAISRSWQRGHKQIRVLTKQQFIKGILYPWCVDNPDKHPTRLLGHTLFFDSTRLIMTRSPVCAQGF